VREQRREIVRLRRTGLLAGALLAAAPAAQAATFQVANTADSGAGSLRDALAQADSAAGDDTITFAPAVTGTIHLASELQVNPATGSDKLTITGPGRDVLALSGDDSTRVLHVRNGTGGTTVTGLTLTHGYDNTPGGSGGGGAILVNASLPVTLSDVAVTDSVAAASDNGGGGIREATGISELTIQHSTLSGNTAAGVGGALGIGTTSKYGLALATVTDSTITGNTAEYGGGVGGSGRLTMSGTTVSGNTATGGGGGIALNTKYQPSTITNSTISGNTATNAGGGLFDTGVSYVYGGMTVRDSTISGNTAPRGAGIDAYRMLRGTKLTVDRSTLSGNSGGTDSWGGGLLVNSIAFGKIEVSQSTISGNTATTGAGVSIGADTTNEPILSKYTAEGAVGSIEFSNSTIARNAASGHGGGIYLSRYAFNPGDYMAASATIVSTVVGDNVEGPAASPNDLDRMDGAATGGFTSAFSLIQYPGNAPLTQQSTFTFVDPQLGQLADNGGPTKTLLPAGTSPLIDQGHAPTLTTVDQRGLTRPVDTGVANATGGDGSDIGAVELPAASVVVPATPAAPGSSSGGGGTTPPPAPAFTVKVGGTTLGGASTALLVAGASPVDCAVSTGALSSCLIEVRTRSASRAAHVRIPAGSLLAFGGEGTDGGGSTITTPARLTAAGRALLARAPLGVDADAKAFGGASSPVSVSGSVHLLANPWFVLPVRGRSTRLSPALLSQIDQAGALINGAAKITCTAHTDRAGSADAARALTAAQAKAACARLAADGLTADFSSVGAGFARPVRAGTGATARRANRRLVIRFSLPPGKAG